MPSGYAHYRFGTQLLPTLPGDIRRTIQRFRGLFDMGLFGPDFFYYSSPLLKSNAGFLGIKFHEQTGKEFFNRVCRMLRLERPEAGIAYLYGVLCHYCLDSVCHPFVIEQAALGEATHVEIETEFDRFLLETDGKIPPCAQNICPNVKLTPGECDAIARFYPPATGRYVRDGINGMAMFYRLFTAPEGPKRKMLEAGMALAGKEFKGMLMTVKPNPRCQALDAPLMALYRQAEEMFPEMLRQLQAHMTYGAPFEEEFAAPFGAPEAARKEEKKQ